MYKVPTITMFCYYVMFCYQYVIIFDITVSLFILCPFLCYFPLFFDIVHFWSFVIIHFYFNDCHLSKIISDFCYLALFISNLIVFCHDLFLFLSLFILWLYHGSLELPFVTGDIHFLWCGSFCCLLQLQLLLLPFSRPIF